MPSLLRPTRTPFLIALAFLAFLSSGFVLAADNSRHCSLPGHASPQVRLPAANAPTVCTDGDNILDGGLEATDPGTLTNPNWATSSTQFGSPLCSVAACGTGAGTAGPRGGTFWSWFGGTTGVGAEVATLAQAVAFPTGATSVTLNFYLWIGSVASPFTDTLEIQIDGVTQTTFVEPSTAEPGYTLRSLDLTSFADGSVHTINFRYNQPAGGGTGNFSVDDISLDVVCGAVFTAEPFSLTVDPLIAAGIPLNGVLEMNEAVGTGILVAPGWTNTGAIDFNLTGVASNFTGPNVGGDVVYTIDNSTADYGTITAGNSANCLNTTGDCYLVDIVGDRTLEPVHMDATIDEDVTPVVPPPFGQPNLILKTWTLHVGESFTDVVNDVSLNPFYPFIETVLHFGVTAGCGDGTTYCPLQMNLREEMAVFVLKEALGSGYTPPDCTGIFSDVPCPATPEFPFSNFIEDLVTRGIASGCDLGPPARFCPGDGVTRAQMAVFLLKASQGSTYIPPDCTGIFSDVPCPATPEFPFSDYVEDLFTRGITTGCDLGPPARYCPDDPVTRDQMAVFLSLAFGATLYGP